MGNFPVVFCHRGNSFYLQYSLMQARKTNPDAEIVLIGDETNDCYPFIKHVRMKIPQGGIEFGKRYIHLSVNPFEYELFCFVRWFVIAAYLVENQIDKFHYIDSDVMLYANINSAEFAKERFSTLGVSMAEGFISTNILKEFCFFLLDNYGEKGVMETLHEEYRKKYASGIIAPISDLTFIEMFIKKHDHYGRNLVEIFRGAVFNEVVRVTDDTEFQPCGKNIRIVLFQGIPYAFHVIKRQWIRLLSIHCQGPDMKHLMKVLWEAPINNDPEKVLCLDENWNWHERYLLEILESTPAKLTLLKDKEEIDSLEYFALLQGHKKMLDSLC